MEGRLLKYLKRELLEFIGLKREKVEFEPTEPLLSLVFTFNSVKKVIVEGWIQYPVGNGAKLDFEAETGLGDIENFVQGIDTILERFPPR